MYILDLMRRLKRNILTDGFAEPTYRFLKKIETLQGDNVTQPKDEYVVNLSFDLEFSVGTYFWRNDFKNALRVGEIARTYFYPTTALLAERGIPYNVQVVGMLLDTHITHSSLLTSEQKTCIESRMNMFQLSESDLKILENPSIDVGVHGYSHRVFTELSHDEAREELKRTLEVFSGAFPKRPKPTFMAFPRNYWAHADILPEYGIESWRSALQKPSRDGRMPRGLWFAPGILNPEDLKRVIDRIQKNHKGYLFHLWNHFTEMDANTLDVCLTIFKKAGWKFMNIKQFREEYG